MSYMLWQRHGEVRIGSPKLVLRAAEVPVLASAQQLCERIDELHAQQQARVDAASAEGFATGHAQGVSEGRRAAAVQVAGTLIELAQASATERDRLRGEVGTLALQVVRKLLGHFAADEVLAALAATAARELLSSRPIALVVHPDDAAGVGERVKSLLGCEVHGDASVPPGTCRLETEHGTVDASLDAQLARLEAAWQA